MKPIADSIAILKQRKIDFPQMGLVLGSGWNKVLDGVEVECTFSYEELFGVQASVPGHEGKLVIGKLKGKRIACMAGRLHTYEGYSTNEVTVPLQVMTQAGLKQIVITSAVGAINERYRVGDFVILADMICLFCTSPLKGPQFVDLSSPFSPSWRSLTRKMLAENDIAFREGTYAYVRGPHFETKADKMALKMLGADVVGMSTVPETIMANKLGVEVLGLSCVTNLAFVKHDHRDVLSAAEAASQKMVQLLEGIVAYGGVGE